MQNTCSSTPALGHHHAPCRGLWETNWSFRTEQLRWFCVAKRTLGFPSNILGGKNAAGSLQHDWGQNSWQWQNYTNNQVSKTLWHSNCVSLRWLVHKGFTRNKAYHFIIFTVLIGQVASRSSHTPSPIQPTQGGPRNISQSCIACSSWLSPSNLKSNCFCDLGC